MHGEQFFLSYSRADAKFTTKLAKDLRRAGIPIWFDKLDITAGKLWDVEIERALNSCNALILVMSSSSVKSTNVMDEVSYALEEGKRVVPVLIDNCKIPLRLRRLQRIDFTEYYDVALKLLLDTISSDVNYNLEKRKDDFGPVLPIKSKRLSVNKWIYLVAGIIGISILLFAIIPPKGHKKDLVADTSSDLDSNRLDEVVVDTAPKKVNVDNKAVVKKVESIKPSITIKPPEVEQEKPVVETKKAVTAPTKNDLHLTRKTFRINTSSGCYEYVLRLKNTSAIYRYSTIQIENNRNEQTVNVSVIQPGLLKDITVCYEHDDCVFSIKGEPSAELVKE